MSNKGKSATASKQGTAGRNAKKEEDLAFFLLQLKEDIREQNNVADAQGLKGSSVSIPKDIEYFGRERRHSLEKLKSLPPHPFPPKVQSDIFNEELDSCLAPDHSEQSLPLLMHQFYVDRVEQLQMCKHLHQLRWSRFSSHNSVSESLLPSFITKMKHIVAELTDSVERAQRLSVARDNALDNSLTATSVVTRDDTIIYVRSLVSQLSSFKRVSFFLKVLKWIHLSNRNDFSGVLTTASLYSSKEESSGSMRQKWENVARLASRHERPLGGDKEAVDGGHDKGTSWKKADNAPSLSMDSSSLPRMSVDVPGSLLVQLEYLTDCYGIPMPANLVSAADELELFYNVNRKFKVIFQQQEEQLTFLEYNDENKEEGHAQQIFMKKATWASEKRPDDGYFESLSYLKVHLLTDVDELLASLSKTLEITDIQRLQFGLKRHSMEVRKPRFVSDDAAKVWDSIIAGINPHDPTFAPPFDLLEAPGNSDREIRVGKRKSGGGGSGNPRGFDFGSAVQLLHGKEDGRLGQQATTNCKNALTAFLYLRHLKIRDLRIKCLNILNYFRSIQRTLAFYESGFSVDETLPDRSGDEKANMRHFMEPQVYKHNSVAEYLLASGSFLETEKTDTISDYYVSRPDGVVSVRDSTDVLVMYDAALEDLRCLEKKLLLMASFYVQKTEEGAEFQSPSLVDRYGVLFDVWSEEALYLESKAELINCYMEAYHNTFAKEERSRLSQLVVEVAVKSPKFDPLSNHFVASYREEIACLKLEKQLVTTLLNDQIERQRSYIRKIKTGFSQDLKATFGLPLGSLDGKWIAVHSDRSALEPVQLFEFHPSLSLCTSVRHALKQALKEILCVFDVKSPMSAILLNRRLLEVALDSWHRLDILTTSKYTREIQSNLFSAKFIENPNSVGRFLHHQADSQASSAVSDEKPLALGIKLLEMVWSRQRLIAMAVETIRLSEIYQDLANEAGFGSFHAFIRPTSLEKVREMSIPGTTDRDQSMSDRYLPTSHSLGVSDVTTDKEITEISFLQAGVVELLETDGVEKIHQLLLAQTASRHVLIVGIQVCQILLTQAHLAKLDPINENAGDGSSSKIDAAALADEYLKRFQCYFLSVQRVKSQARFRASVEYRKKVSSMRDRRDLLKLKREAVVRYCREIVRRLTIISLRVEIFLSYFGLQKSLDDFPLVWQTYFQHSDVTIEDCRLDEVTPVAASTTKQFLLSADGERVLSLWSIPNFIEIMKMFEELDENETRRRLQQVLCLSSSLYTLISYFLAETWLCQSAAGKHTINSTISWKDQDGLGSRIQDFQELLSSFGRPLELSFVAEYLMKHARVMFLSYYMAVFHHLKDTCLTTGNEEIYDHLSKGVDAFLMATANVPLHPTLPYLVLPQPVFDATSDLFPWLTFCSSGSRDLIFLRNTLRFSLRFPFSGVSRAGRNLAQGEVLNLSMELRELREIWSAQNIGAVSVQENLISYLSSMIRIHALQEEWAKMFLGIRRLPGTVRQCQGYKESLEALFQLHLKDKQLSREEKSPALVLERLQRKVDLLTRELESAMIEETHNHLDKQHDLVLTERMRRDGNLPLDLWSSKTEEMCLIPLPSFVEECFSSLSECFSEDQPLIKEKLNAAMEKLASKVMSREKLVFNSYSTFYDSILRQLYKAGRLKDAENQKLRADLEHLAADASVDLQFKLLDKVQGVFLEMSRLRAKVKLLEKKLEEKATHLSTDIRSSYGNLVQKLSSSSEDVKLRYEKFRGELFGDVLNSIQSVRTAALQGLQKIKGKRALSVQGKDMEQLLGDVHDGVDMQKENAGLLRKVVQMRHGHVWSRAAMRSFYEKKLDEVRRELKESKTAFFEYKMIKDEEIFSANKRIKAVQQALKEMEDSQKILKKRLVDEKATYAKKVQDLKTLSSSQMVNKHQDEEREQLLAELQNHQMAVKQLAEMREQSLLRAEHEKSKSQKVTRRLVHQVQQERSLKKDAFVRVVDLQEQVADYEVYATDLSLAAQSSSGFGRSIPFERSSRPSTSLAYLSDGSTMSLLPGQIRRPKSTGSRLFTSEGSKTKLKRRSEVETPYEVDLKLY